MPRGRPSSYTEEKGKEIVEHILAGNSKTNAFKLAGFHPDVVFAWLKRGKEDPDRYPELAELHENVEEATAHVQGEMAQRIRLTALSGAPNTWQAAAWYLERTDPANWGKRDQVKIEADKPLIQLNQVVLEDPETRAIGRDLLRRVALAPSRLALGPGAD